MVIGCVIFSTKSLNNEVGMSPLSDKLSPSALITGQPQQNYNEVTSIIFGEYAEVYGSMPIINTNEERTISAIALYPSGNLQRGWMFFSLNTDRVLHRHQWKKLPITDKIVIRVEEMATKEGQPYVSSNFKYDWNRVKLDSDDTTEANDELEMTHDNITEDDRGLCDTPSFHEIADEVDEIMILDTDSMINDGDTRGLVDSTDGKLYDERPNESIQDLLNDEVGTDEDEGTASEVVDDRTDISDMVETPEGRYNLRGCTNINYKNMHRYGKTQLMQLQEDWISEKQQDNCNKNSHKKVNLKTNDLYRRVIGVTMTQMSKEDKYAQVSVNEGIKRHGEKAIAAVLAEFGQLNNKQVFKPYNAHQLTNAVKREALNLITMIKQKETGRLKAEPALMEGSNVGTSVKTMYLHQQCSLRAL